MHSSGSEPDRLFFHFSLFSPVIRIDCSKHIAALAFTTGPVAASNNLTSREGRVGDDDDDDDDDDDEVEERRVSSISLCKASSGEEEEEEEEEDEDDEEEEEEMFLPRCSTHAIAALIAFSAARCPLADERRTDSASRK